MNLFDVSDCGCSLGAFNTVQPCLNAPALESEVSGIVIVPTTSPMPSDWTTQEGWAGVVNNEATDNTQGRFLAVIGSFSPVGEAQGIELSRGRYRVNEPRLWVANLETLDLTNAHPCFASMLDSGFRNFRFWLQTVGGRLIGGPNGIAPAFATGNPVWQSGEASIERLVFRLESWGLPQTVSGSDIDFSIPMLTADCDNSWIAVTGANWALTNDDCFELV